MTTPIMNQYHEIKKQHQNCLLFFRLGDFYELFYEDAKIASQILGITLTKRHQKNEDVPMAGIPFHTCDHYIAKLIKNRQKIAICEQVETSQNKANKIIHREVVRIITSGTITDDSILNSKRNNFLVALVSSNFNIFASVFDLSTNEFFVEIFEPIELKNFLEKIEPSEILISQQFVTKFQNYKHWENIITFVQEIDIKSATSKLLDFFQLHSISSLNFNHHDCFIASAMVIDYIKFTQKNKINNISLPKQKNSSHSMQLDKFTRRNLEIVKTLQNEHTGSLLWLLDKTKTAQGARLLFKIINEPINDIDQLNNRQKRIDDFLQNTIILKETREILAHIPDFERLLTKIALSRFLPIDLCNLAIGINNFFTLSEKLKISINPIASVTNKILSAITQSSDNSFINFGFDSELDEWKIFHRDINDRILELQENYKIETKISNLRIKFIENVGFVVEINSSNKEKLSYNFILIQELKNCARYISNDLENINKQFMQIQESIENKEKEILNQLAKEILIYSENINQYSKISAEIDLFSNFAKISQENNYVKPELTLDKSFLIKNGKHPILDQIFKQNGEIFVSNNCNMEQCVMFMTGPNMAGKSTYLRQQALIAFLAHIGMFVPANYAKIGLIDCIFSRIGAGDNIAEGNSTFMMEMIEIALTINQATEKSFIIFDEVGRGTSVNEGMAIAGAILEYLIETLKARTIFATHYLQLKNIEHNNLQKKMMEIMEDSNCEHKINFTHKLIDGVAEKSWALSVASMAGLPNQIIENAKKLMKKFSM